MDSTDSKVPPSFSIPSSPLVEKNGGEVTVQGVQPSNLATDKDLPVDSKLTGAVNAVQTVDGEPPGDSIAVQPSRKVTHRHYGKYPARSIAVLCGHDGEDPE